jgi:hypothetical protein
MGRRKQSDTSETYSATVTIQVTPSQRAELDKRAAAAGVRLSDYARAALLDFQLNVRSPLTERGIYELGAIGNNLNQLARRANTTEQIDPQELSDALRLWREVVARLYE